MTETKSLAKKTTTAIAPIDSVRGALTQMQSQFKMALPANVTPEKFIRVTMTAIQNNPKLLDCTRQSLYSAAMKCAQDGLLPDGRQAALVPFKDKAGNSNVQYMPMTAGILQKVRNSGELASISPQVVFENDEFSFWVDEKGEHLLHRPKLTGERGEAKFAYAVAKTKDGSAYIEVMSADEIEQVRQVSRSKDTGPWRDWPGEMWKKTVIRRLSKRLPMSTDLEEVIHRDDELYDVKKEDAVKEVAAPKNKSSRLAAIVETQVEPEEASAPAETEPKDEEVPI